MKRGVLYGDGLAHEVIGEARRLLSEIRQLDERIEKHSRKVVELQSEKALKLRELGLGQ